VWATGRRNPSRTGFGPPGYALFPFALFWFWIPFPAHACALSSLFLWFLSASVSPLSRCAAAACCSGCHRPHPPLLAGPDPPGSSPLTPRRRDPALPPHGFAGAAASPRLRLLTSIDYASSSISPDLTLSTTSWTPARPRRPRPLPVVCAASALR
jgi:hypothetical protein